METNEKLSILLVEDSSIFLNIVEEMLGGYDLVSVTTYEEGLAKYKEIIPNITFLDISLPDGNGHDLLKEIRRINPAAFVIMMTASRLKEDILQSMEEGAEGYIMKPFSSDMVKECIKEYYEYKAKNLEK